MNYFELRHAVAEITPRSNRIMGGARKVGAVKEKGRKSNYKEYKVTQGKWVKHERLLNEQEVNSFVEISCRAAACPMPLNADVWDGLVCPFNCCYCFANAFRASLYTAFFDNSRSMGIRHCDPNKYKRELQKIFDKCRGNDPHDFTNPIHKAIAMNLPMRFGIRFEDFLGQEKKAGVSLELLRFLGECEYPVMVNTKSGLIGQDNYVRALSENKGKAAVHVTLISKDNNILKTLEPGAPPYEHRMKAMANLAEAGVRVVARIEPWMPFVNDDERCTREYMKDLKGIGVRNLTFDTYSYTAKNPGIANAFRNAGMDWERIFTLGCDSQALGSILMGKFMDLWREEGFSCSTFDMGNVPTNDQSICCEVGDWFGDGFNYGSTVMAARYVMSKKGKAVTWSSFLKHVNKHGGFLSDALKGEVRELWNCTGNDAYSHAWAAGIHAVGEDRDGMIWCFTNNQDFRQELLHDILQRGT